MRMPAEFAGLGCANTATAATTAAEVNDSMIASPRIRRPRTPWELQHGRLGRQRLCRRTLGRRRTLASRTRRLKQRARSCPQVCAVAVVPVPPFNGEVEVARRLERYMCRCSAWGGTVPMPSIRRVADDVAGANHVDTVLICNHAYSLDEDEVLAVVMLVRHRPCSCTEVHR